MNGSKFLALMGLLSAGIWSELWAAAPKADSLTRRLIGYADSAYRLRKTNRNTAAFALLQTALRHPARQQSPITPIQRYYELGIMERKQSRFQEGITALKQADSVAIHLYDTTQLYRVSYALSVLYADQGNYTTAVDQCHHTLTYCTEPHSTGQKATVLLLLRELYKRLGNQTLVKEYTNRYIQLAALSRKPVHHMLAELVNAQVWDQKNDYRQALVHRTRALSLGKTLPIPDQLEYLTDILSELARTHRQLRQWQPADRALNDALYWVKRNPSTHTLALIYMEIASLLTARNKHRQAVQAGERAVTFARLSHRPDILLASLDSLQGLQARNGQYQAAWLTTKFVRQLADSLATVAKAQTIAQAETRYKLANKENTIQQLGKSNASKKLKAEVSQRKLVPVRYHPQLLTGLLAGLLAILGVIGYLLIRTRRLQRQTEQQCQLLESQTTELQTTNYTKDKLFSIVSHDLRAPVNGLQYLLQEAQQSDFQGAMKAALLSQLTERVNQLSRLINNLLYWSLAQQGRLHDRLEWINIGEVVADCQALFTDIIQRKALVMRISGPVTQVWADENQLPIIIRNVLDNAVKFSPIGSTIRVYWVSDPTGVSLEVRNPTAAPIESVPSANLGLRVVTELIERHNGSVTNSQPGESDWRISIHLPNGPGRDVTE